MPHPSSVVLDIPVLRQPDEVSCGPTTLTQVLGHAGDPRGFGEVDAQVERNSDGGTLGVFLGEAALSLGYRATLYSFNFRVFDPTWSKLSPTELRARLAARAENVPDPRLAYVVSRHCSFLDAGGEVRFDDLSAELLIEWIDRGRPIIAGLSATYLYGISREDPMTCEPDDIAGEPAGHFVVIGGYREGGQRFVLFDPYGAAPISSQPTYEVPERRLLNAILLGDVTYDGVLLVVEPAE